MARLIGMAEDAEVRLLMLRLGVIETTVIAMFMHPDHVELQATACELLATFADEGESRAIMMGMDATTAVVAALLQHTPSERLCHSAMECLTHFSRDNRYGHLVSSDPAPLVGVLKAMRLHPTHKRAQASACHLLSVFVKDSSLHRKLAALGAVELAVKAVAACRGNAKVVEDCLTLCGQLTDDEHVVLRHSLPAISRAILAHATDACIQEPAIASLNGILCRCEGGAKAFLDGAGISTVAACMRAHIGVESIQLGWCGVIDRLAVDDLCRRKIVDDGGIDCIVGAARAHTGCADLRRMGVRLLCKLPREHELRLKHSDRMLILTVALIAGSTVRSLR
eukprot:Opistho-2@47197